MSNSGLVTYTHISPNKTVGRNHAIDTISIHCMAGNLTIETCGSVFAPSSARASSNYGIGSDGRIGMYVEEKDRSWCTSNSGNDNRAVTIEVANDGGAPDWHVSDAAMSSLIKLCADICFRNNIKKLMWHGDKSLIGQVDKQNMTVHRWFSNKECPGNYLYNKHGYIAQEVNKLLNIPYNPADYTVSGSSAPGIFGNYSYVDPTSLVDATKIYPYIATLSPDMTYVDCSKLKENDVVGVMVYGGCYYTISHQVRKLYRANNIRKQITCLDESDMPYAIYVKVRSRSVSEAKLECRQLWYLVSKYPPKLGLWLKIETGAKTAINDLIIEEYYTNIERWGMKDQCGIYATRSDMKSFTWDKFYDRFSLWLVDPVSDMGQVVDQLLKPEFFMLGEV